MHRCVPVRMQVALGSLCAQGGYGGLEELVSVNADYIVDGLCRQLRRLDMHPRYYWLQALMGGCDSCVSHVCNSETH